jgi:hypothetical protein
MMTGNQTLLTPFQNARIEFDFDLVFESLQDSIDIVIRLKESTI